MPTSPERLDPQTMLPVSAVVWGPFPLRRARLAGGLGILAMALLLIVVGLQRQRIRCARSGSLAEQCELQTGLAARNVRRFPLRSLRAVRVVYSETSSKGHVTHWGQLMLGLPDRELTLFRQPAEAADKNAAALQTFLRDPQQDQVHIDSGWSVETLVIGGSCALGALAMLYSVWSGRRRYLFTWEPSMQQLSRQLQWPLGIIARNPDTFFLREPVEVEIQWAEVTGFFTSARSPGPRGGRLLVRLADGSTVELLPRPLPGYRVHLRAAEELRRLLRCPSRSAAEAARITASYEAEKPQLGPGWTGIGGRIAATWLGACCGSVLGIAVGGVLALLLGFAKASDNAGGPWFYGGMLGGTVAGVVIAWRLLLRPDER